jgi:hypothetical protein
MQNAAETDHYLAAEVRDRSPGLDASADNDLATVVAGGSSRRLRQRRRVGVHRRWSAVAACLGAEAVELGGEALGGTLVVAGQGVGVEAQGGDAAVGVTQAVGDGA